MKKTLILMLIGILLLVGCGGSVVKGDILFNGKIDEVSKIELLMPDETVVVIEDEDQVEKICSALIEATYEKRAESDLIGGYIMKLVSDEETIELYYGINYLGFDGIQYDINGSELEKVFFEVFDIN